MLSFINEDLYLTAFAKILYVDEDYLLYYECLKGDKLTDFGACDRRYENLELMARKRNINSVDKQKLKDLALAAVCFSPQDIVMSNHTSKSGIYYLTFE